MSSPVAGRLGCPPNTTGPQVSSACEWVHSCCRGRVRWGPSWEGRGRSSGQSRGDCGGEQLCSRAGRAPGAGRWVKGSGVWTPNGENQLPSTSTHPPPPEAQVSILTAICWLCDLEQATQPLWSCFLTCEILEVQPGKREINLALSTERITIGKGCFSQAGDDDEVAWGLASGVCRDLQG